MNDKCIIPCGGVGYLPRAHEPKYELESACSRCTKCDRFRRVEGDDEMITSQSECESAGCCQWKDGWIYGGYCRPNKRGDCGTRMGDYPESSSAQVLSYPGSVNEGMKCNQLPALGVAYRHETADKAGFELRECENPTDVCAMYCVSVKVSSMHGRWINSGMFVCKLHQCNLHATACATKVPIMSRCVYYCHAGWDEQVSCSHGCFPAQVGSKPAQDALEEVRRRCASQG